jgi:hypothetical protein
MLYDESLMRSEPTGISMVLLKAAVQVLEIIFARQEGRAVIIKYAKDAYAVLKGTLERGGGVVTLPSLEAPPYSLTPTQITEAANWTRTGRHAGTTGNAATLLELNGKTVRVIDADQGGMLSYEISVPNDLTNIIILDASHPIRRLLHLDPTIRDAEKHIPACRNLKTPLSRIKRYDKVVLRMMYAGGGRSTLEQDFGSNDKAFLNDVIDVVRNRVPREEAVLIFCFKHRYTDKNAVDFRGVILDGLKKAGVDLDGTVPVKVKTRDKKTGKLVDEIVDKPRINIATYGQETNLNCWSHCRKVILAGVLQLPRMTVGASGVGQADDLKREVEADDLRDWHRSEIAHIAYQALSRGANRNTDQGVADPTEVWIRHLDRGLPAQLERVMPGVRQGPWKSVHRLPGTTEALATAIAAHLEALPQGTDRISTRKVKVAMEKTEKDGTPAGTWTDAVRCLFGDLGCTLWGLEGRSFVRTDSVFEVEDH